LRPGLAFLIWMFYTSRNRTLWHIIIELCFARNRLFSSFFPNIHTHTHTHIHTNVQYFVRITKSYFKCNVPFYCLKWLNFWKIGVLSAFFLFIFLSLYLYIANYSRNCRKQIDKNGLSGVNFINILLFTFLLMFWCQKNCKAKHN